MNIIRSLLFVPGDSERKLGKAGGNPADALILDLEDSVANERQDIAREMVLGYLREHTDRSRQQIWLCKLPNTFKTISPGLRSELTHQKWAALKCKWI